MTVGFQLRPDSGIRVIKSVDGQTYYLQRSAYGFFEQYTFYDEQGNEIESFEPYDDGEFIDVYETDDYMGYYKVFRGIVIQAKFTMEEFDKEV